MAEPNFSLVLPCYNEEAAITPTVNDLRQSLRDAGPYELIIVDDGSTDRSAEIVDALSSPEDGIRVFHHDRNRGYGAALKTGIRRAGAEIIVITDADGTYPCGQIPALLEGVGDADMVVGARTGRNVHQSRVRMIPKKILQWYCSWISGHDIPDINSGLRVFRKSVAEDFMNILPNGFSFTVTITLAMLMNNYIVRYIPIDYAERIGKSKIRPIRDTLNFIQLIVRTGTYFAPLRVFFPLIVILGLGFLASFIFDIFILGNLTDKTIILLLFCLNTTMLALLADMIDKRKGR